MTMSLLDESDSSAPSNPAVAAVFCVASPLTKKTGEKKYDAAVGTKGYRWLESEMVKELGKEDCIDRRYYDALVDAAATDISKYGDFEWFVSEDPYVSDTPPWFSPRRTPRRRQYTV